MTPTIAAFVWAIGIVAWLAIRIPRRRKAKRTKVIADRVTLGERVTLGLCIVGLVIIPTIFFATDIFNSADFNFYPALGWFGALVMASFIGLFYLSHKQLDKNWSVTLEVREDHKLIDHGLYAHIRHPMYTSFWLWGIAQTMLIPNWVAGFAGIVSVAILYFSRIGNEEAMMRQQFGSAYDEYCSRTKRLVPKLF